MTSSAYDGEEENQDIAEEGLVAAEENSTFVDEEWGAVTELEAESESSFFEEPIVEISEQENTSSDMNLTEFAETSSGQGGFLRYNLYLEGIDTLMLREEFAEALSDPKFMWDSDKILEKIENGNLKLENMTPVKASVLINKIKLMSIKYSWEQLNVNQV